MPLPSMVHIDKFLTGHMAGIKNEAYIADEVLPPLTPTSLTGKVARFGKDHLRVHFSDRRAGSPAYRVDWNSDSVDFNAKEFSVENAVDDQDKNQYDNPFDAMRDGAFVVDEVLKNKREELVASLLMTEANYPTGSKTNGGLWATGYDIITEVAAAIDAVIAQTGMSPDNIYGVCSWAIFSILRRNDGIRDSWLNTQPGQPAMGNMDRSKVAAALGLRDLWVGTAVQNTGKEGGTEAVSYIWGNAEFLVFAKTPTPSLRMPNLGYLITPRIPGLPGSAQIAFDRYREEKIKSDVVRGTLLMDQILAQLEYGHLLYGLDA